jgi:hypothetical protein
MAAEAERERIAMSASDRVPRQLPDCNTEDFHGETLLYWPSLEKMIYLNEIAAVIWNMCDGHRTVQQIVDELAGAYPEASALVGTDVVQAIEALIREGAIQVDAAADATPD